MPFTIRELDSDTFDGTENPLATPWETIDGAGMQKTDPFSEAGAGLADSDDVSAWLVSVRDYPDDQWAEVVMDNEAGSSDGVGCTVRSAETDLYLLAWWGFAASSFAVVESHSTGGFVEHSVINSDNGTAGDVIRLEIQGDTWTLYQNGFATETQSGFTAITTGQPGLYGIRGNVADSTVGSWRAGDFLQVAPEGITIWNSMDPAPTGGATADLARDGEETVPNAAIHFVTNAIAFDSVWNPAKWGIGFSDGTDDRWIASGSQHGLAEPDTQGRNSSTGCIGILEHAASTKNGECSHNAWIPGGQRIDVDQAFGQAHLIGSMYFDVDFAKVMTANVVTQDTPVNLDPGAEWKCCIVIGVPDLGDNAATDAVGQFYYGFFDKTKIGSILYGEFSTSPTVGAPDKQLRTDYVGGKVSTVDADMVWGLEIALASGNSIDLTPKLDTPLATSAVYVMFLGWDSPERVKVHQWEMPNNTTGSFTETGVGWPGQAILNIMGGCATVNAPHTDEQAGSFAFGTLTPSQATCHALAIEDNATTTDTQSIVEPIFISQPYDNGLFTPDGWSSGFRGFNNDGWDHEVIFTNDGFAAQQFALVFEQTPNLNLMPAANSSTMVRM